MLRRILMFGTVLILLSLILITPLYLERDTSLAAIPRLLIDHVQGETRIYVQGAVETTRYPYVVINVTDISGSDWNSSIESHDTIGLGTTVQDANSTHFQLNITLMRGNDLFEYGCEVEIGEDENGETISVLLPERDDPIIAAEDSFPYRDVIVQEVES